MLVVPRCEGERYEGVDHEGRRKEVHVCAPEADGRVAPEEVEAIEEWEGIGGIRWL